MVNTVTDHPCVYNSATGTLTIRGLGTIDFAALVEEFKSTGGVLDPGEPIVLKPGQLRSGGIASEFPSVFDRQKAEQNMAFGRVLYERIMSQFSSENCI